MLTYITHGCTQNASFEYDDLHLPCVLKIHWSMLTYITHGCNQNDPFEYDDLQKYVNLHHPVSFTYWKPEVCWLTSPMGAIRMLHLSMLTCKSMSTYITQYLLLIEILKYVDLHHPCVSTIQWSMLTCITPLCSRSYEVCWVTSPSFSFGFWNPDIIDWYNWAVPMSMIQPSWYVPHGWR